MATQQINPYNIPTTSGPQGRRIDAVPTPPISSSVPPPLQPPNHGPRQPNHVPRQPNQNPDGTVPPPASTDPSVPVAPVATSFDQGIDPGTSAAIFTPQNLPSAPVGTVTPSVAEASLAPTAAQWNVDPNQTVASQVKGLIDANSPLMQRASALAEERANSRGLQNTSMAVQAGQSALYDAAMPIATADANTYARAGEFNTAATNAVNSQNANLQTQTNQFNSDAATRSSMANADSANKLQSQNLDIGFKTASQNATARNASLLAKMDADLKTALASADNATRLQLQNLNNATQIDLANIDASNKTLMQTSASAQGLYGDVISGITQTMLSTNLTPDAKQQAVSNQLTLLQGGMTTLGAISNLNLGSLLNFSVT